MPSVKFDLDDDDDHTRIPVDLRGLPSLYTHPDPLVKRLRLDDPYGRPIENARKAFDGKELVVFFVGSEYGDTNLKELHRDLTEMQMAEHKWLQVIYVSTDSSADVISRVCHNKPYLRLTPHDDSDFAPLAKSEESARSMQAEMHEVARGEDFVLAEEVEMGKVSLREGHEERDNSAYARPFSRAALTHILLSLQTPSLAVYHLPTHHFVARNVRASTFRPSGERDRKLAEWRGGKGAGIGWWDVWDKLKLPILFALVAVLYQIAIVVLGEEYNVIPQIVEAFQGHGYGASAGSGAGRIPVPPPHATAAMKHGGGGAFGGYPIGAGAAVP